jgi:hypothetical protein
MLFLALGKAKGPAKIRTVKPILIIKPPPEPSNPIPIDPFISMDVFEEMERKGFAAGGKVQGLNDGSRSRSLHQGMQAPPPWLKPDPVIIPTVEKRKFYRGLFKLSFIELLFFIRKISFRKHR